MFEKLKIVDQSDICENYVSVRFPLDVERANKIRSVVDVDRMCDGDADGWFYGEIRGVNGISRYSVFYGIADDANEVELIISTYVDLTEDEHVDGTTHVKFDADRAWMQFISPLRLIKEVLAA